MQINLTLVLLLFNAGLSMSAKIAVQSWGDVDGKTVKKYTLKNDLNQEIDIISFGATITSIRTPDKNGKIEDIVLGFDNIEGYLSKENPYFGATIGRVANRIGKGRFKIDGQVYEVSKNIGQNTLHGGLVGWSHKVWESSINGDTLIMTLNSEDGDQGFPGDVQVIVTFQLDNEGALTVKMKATSSKATIINLTNHSYFNLGGHGSNATEIYKHEVKLNADRWTVTDNESIPTGEIRSVKNSIMDLTSPVCLGQVINKVPGGGYDYNFCLPGNVDYNTIKLVGIAVHPPSGRILEVHSNQPGVQFYTANSLPDPKSKGVLGKEGKSYFKHGALCLETQNYPDAINHDNFPSSILRPGEEYHHIVTYKFLKQA